MATVFATATATSSSTSAIATSGSRDSSSTVQLLAPYASIGSCCCCKRHARDQILRHVTCTNQSTKLQWHNEFITHERKPEWQQNTGQEEREGPTNQLQKWSGASWLTATSTHLTIGTTQHGHGEIRTHTHTHPRTHTHTHKHTHTHTARTTQQHSTQQHSTQHNQALIVRCRYTQP
jgi:hypothetical protein